MGLLRNRFIAWKLNRAIKNFDEEQASKLNERNSNVLNQSIEDDTGHCPLTYAVDKKCLKTVRFVMSLGSDPNVHVNTNSGLSALHYMAQYSSFDHQASLILDELMSGAGEKLNVDAEVTQCLPDGNYIQQTPLMTAVIHENQLFVRELIKRGANVNYIDSMMGATPLLLACGQASCDLIRILLGAGASIKQCSTGQYGPLHWFASNNRDVAECVELLVDEGISVNQATLNEMATPLMFAACNGLYNSIVVMIQHGADPTLQDVHGRNAIAYARLFEDYDVVDKMIEAITAKR